MTVRVTGREVAATAALATIGVLGVDFIWPRHSWWLIILVGALAGAAVSICSDALRRRKASQ